MSKETKYCAWDKDRICDSTCAAYTVFGVPHGENIKEESFCNRSTFIAELKVFYSCIYSSGSVTACKIPKGPSLKNSSQVLNFEIRYLVK